MSTQEKKYDERCLWDLNSITNLYKKPAYELFTEMSIWKIEGNKVNRKLSMEDIRKDCFPEEYTWYARNDK